MPRAERLGAFEGAVGGLAFRFEGTTLPGGVLACVSSCLAACLSADVFLDSGAEASCFGGLEFASGLEAPAGCAAVVADFLRGIFETILLI